MLKLRKSALPLRLATDRHPCEWGACRRLLGATTHALATDPEARLYRKGKGKPAQLCFMGHVLIENGNGLSVGAHLTQATGTAGREAKLVMIDEAHLRPGATLGADKAYHAAGFRQALRGRDYVPHTALRSDAGWAARRSSSRRATTPRSVSATGSRKSSAG
jgi:hypothetical protein